MRAPTRTSAHTVIVGAGPAGAALGLLLARASQSVTLIEQERDFARVFRGEGLMPSGIEALHQMGLGTDFEEHWELRHGVTEVRLGEGGEKDRADFG